MKSPLLLILAILIFGKTNQAQYTFYDAQTLDGLILKVSESEYVFTLADVKWQEVLVRYDHELREKTDVKYQEIENKYLDNPFIKPYLPQGEVSSGEQRRFNIGGMLGGLGAIDVTKFADGLAKFLVKRTKEELNIAFFERLSEAFEKYPETKILFPSTTNILENIYSHQYATVLVLLRESFISDLEDLAGNLKEIRSLSCTARDFDSHVGEHLSPRCKLAYTSCINAGNLRDECLALSCVSNSLDENCNRCTSCLRYQDFFNSVHGEVFISVSIMLDELLKGTNPLDVMHIIAMDSSLRKKQSNYANFIQFADLISMSLRADGESGNVWVSPEEMVLFVQNQRALELFMGLLYQENRYRTINFKTSNGQELSLADLLLKFKENSQGFKQYLTSFAGSSGKANQQMRMMGGAGVGIAAGGQLFQQYLDNILESIEQLFNVDIFNENIKVPDELRHLIKALRSGFKVYRNLELDNYSGALTHVFDLLDNSLFEKFEFKQEFLQYATFLALVAEAENSDDVSEIIEEFALPAGSSRIKRESKMNVALNSYVGGFYGQETITEMAGDNQASVAGITSPVGISLSKGFKINGKKKTRELGSLTLFVPIIDVGTFTSFRFNDDSTSTLPAVKFENILAPGGFLIYGIPKTPISVGGGAQMGPLLREFSETETTVSESLNWRWNIFISVDIPLFSFYTKPR